MTRDSMEITNSERVLTFQQPVLTSSHIVTSALWPPPCEEILPFHLVFWKNHVDKWLFHLQAAFVV